MEGRRNALIIATDEYEDTRLRRLRAPVRDAEELGRVLADDAIGAFDVEILHNEPEYILRRRLAGFFADRNRDDLLLVHFSCHGLKDDDGTLYFATSDTEIKNLDSTAVPSHFVNRQMQRSRSQRIALFLDCCYSGAFSRGAMARAGDGVQLAERFDGQGQVVITASNATEYAFEGDELTGEGTPSLFTTAIVEGLESGAADRDGDELVSIDELYDYIYERVREQSANQTPSKWTYNLQGELYVARNPRPRPVTPAELPSELRQALESPLTSVRLGIVGELERLASGSNARVASAARIALDDLSEDDSRAVSAAATEALERAEAVKPQTRFGPEIIGEEGSVRSSATFATPAPTDGATLSKSEAGPPSAEMSAMPPRWWPLQRVPPRTIVLALGLVGAGLILWAASSTEGETAARWFYIGGLSAATALATILSFPRSTLAVSASGALATIGLLSVAAGSTFVSWTSSGYAAAEPVTTLAGTLVLVAGIVAVATTAGIRSEDWTPSLLRSRLGITAALLAVVGGGLCAAALTKPLTLDGLSLRSSYFGNADRLAIIAAVLGVAGLAVTRLVGPARLVAAGVLTGAGLQTGLYFGALVIAFKHYDENTSNGTILGIAGGATLIVAGCMTYLTRWTTETYLAYHTRRRAGTSR